MLRTLRVKDFAIINEITLELYKGFTVFTGETGAGKSILIDALNLVVGGRASSEVIRDGKKEALIEALFEDIKNPVVLQKLDIYDLRDGNDLVIRRIISRNGRGRVFINGSPVTLSMLEDICNGLVDIHGQNEHQILLNKNHHLHYLN